MKYKENININKQLWEQSNIIYKQKESHGFVSIIKSQRFDTTIFKGIGSKKELKKYLNKYPDNKAIAQILDKMDIGNLFHSNHGKFAGININTTTNNHNNMFLKYK